MEILLGQPLVKLNRATSTWVESYMTIDPLLRLLVRSDSRMPLFMMSLNQPHILSWVESGGAIRTSDRSGALLRPASVLTVWLLPSLPTCCVDATSISTSRPDTLARMVTTSPSISRKKFWAMSGSTAMRSLGIYGAPVGQG